MGQRENHDLRHLRHVAEERLLSYRADHARICAGQGDMLDPEWERLNRWYHAISAVRRRLRTDDPTRARYIDFVFQIDARRPRRARLRPLTIRASMDMAISESTAYRWRADVLNDIVLYYFTLRPAAAACCRKIPIRRADEDAATDAAAPQECTPPDGCAPRI